MYFVRAAAARDEHLGRRDDLVAARVVLADPHLVEAEAVEMLDQVEVALERERRVLPGRVERGHEESEAHARHSTRNLTARSTWRKPAQQWARSRTCAVRHRANSWADYYGSCDVDPRVERGTALVARDRARSAARCRCARRRARAAACRRRSARPCATAGAPRWPGRGDRRGRCPSTACSCRDCR